MNLPRHLIWFLVTLLLQCSFSCLSNLLWEVKLNLKKNRIALLCWLTLILLLGSIATSIAIHSVASNSLRQSIVERELPITSDSLYSEIQHDLVLPVFISGQMASNTLLHDWALAGEEEVDAISRYLNEVKSKQNSLTSFFVSEATKNYYSADGLFKTVSPTDEADQWYYRVKDLQQPYEINVDYDATHNNMMTVFVNYRIVDTEGNFLGVTGIGLSLDSVAELVQQYQKRYKRKIYFVDREGHETLNGLSEDQNSNSIRNQAGIQEIAERILAGGKESVRSAYKKNGISMQVNSRYIEKLRAFLIVEQSADEALAPLNQFLSVSLVLSAISSLLVIGIILHTADRHHKQAEKIASIDVLTGLENRMHLTSRLQSLVDNHRTKGHHFSIVMFDIDHFKKINDQHGHLAGDQVLVRIAQCAQQQIRTSDRIYRWGGEEFLVLLERCQVFDAMKIAEKIRRSVETLEIQVADDVSLLATISLGVGQSEVGETTDDFLARVDNAVYLAKQKGRNQTEVSEVPELTT